MSLSQIASAGFYKKQKVLAHLLIKSRCFGSKSSACVFKVANVILFLSFGFSFCIYRIVHLTSNSNGQKTVGCFHFVQHFSQLIFAA
jgi:hypothetical protein